MTEDLARLHALLAALKLEGERLRWKEALLRRPGKDGEPADRLTEEERA